MEKFLIEPTKVTPLVFFDPKEGILEIKGRSNPKNSISFYHRILNNLALYTQSNSSSFTASFAFDYFNTSSSKCLFDILRRLKVMESKGKNLRINWYFELGDDDMMEAGEDYANLLDLEFHFLEIEEL